MLSLSSSKFTRFGCSIKASFLANKESIALKQVVLIIGYVKQSMNFEHRTDGIHENMIWSALRNVSFCPGLKTFSLLWFLFGSTFNIYLKKLFSEASFFQCSLDKKQSNEQKSIMEQSSESPAEKASNSMQIKQVNKKTIMNSQYSMQSTTESAKGSKTTQRCQSSKRFLPTLFSFIHQFRYRVS